MLSGILEKWLVNEVIKDRKDLRQLKPMQAGGAQLVKERKTLSENAELLLTILSQCVQEGGDNTAS